MGSRSFQGQLEQLSPMPLSILSSPLTLKGDSHLGNPLGSLRLGEIFFKEWEGEPISEKISSCSAKPAAQRHPHRFRPAKGQHGQFLSVRADFWTASRSKLGDGMFPFLALWLCHRACNGCFSVFPHLLGIYEGQDPPGRK